jgi:septal ring factor EnvC (AmiA/AmiB activator)
MRYNRRGQQPNKPGWKPKDAPRRAANALKNSAFPKPGSLPPMRFQNLSESSSRPVAGPTITAFGGDDGLGGTAQGDTIEVKPGAYVAAPRTAGSCMPDRSGHTVNS